MGTFVRSGLCDWDFWMCLHIVFLVQMNILGQDLLIREFLLKYKEFYLYICSTLIFFFFF